MTFDILTLATFIFSGALICWIYILYYIFLKLTCKLFSKYISPDPNYKPTVSIIIPTYNEQADIKLKIENILNCTYPKDLTEIIVVDSCSNDGTRQIVESFSKSGVTLIKETQRKGKALALHIGIKAAKHDFVLVTDANCYFSPNTIGEILSYFSNRIVGGVTAGLSNPPHKNSILNFGSRAYWHADFNIKLKEASLHSVIGMIGELMAFRRSIFEKSEFTDWHCNNGADDTALSYFIINKGYRILMAENTLVSEKSAQNYPDLLRQRGRVIAQNIHNSLKMTPILGLKFGWYSVLILPTRRFIALLSPYLLLLNISTTFLLYLKDDGIFLLSVLLFQLIIFILAIPIFRFRFAILCHHFLLINVVIVYGWYIYFTDKNLNIWKSIQSSRNH